MEVALLPLSFIGSHPSSLLLPHYKKNLSGPWGPQKLKSLTILEGVGQWNEEPSSEALWNAWGPT